MHQMPIWPTFPWSWCCIKHIALICRQSETLPQPGDTHYTLCTSHSKPSLHGHLQEFGKGSMCNELHHGLTCSVWSALGKSNRFTPPDQILPCHLHSTFLKLGHVDFFEYWEQSCVVQIGIANGNIKTNQNRSAHFDFFQADASIAVPSKPTHSIILLDLLINDLCAWDWYRVTYATEHIPYSMVDPFRNVLW